jgi:hypothetical protein
MPEEITTSVESETPTADPQTETVTTPADAGETPEETTEPQLQSSSTDDVAKELERLKAELASEQSARKKANAEAAKHRHAAKELEDLKSQIESEKLSTQEKLEKRLADLQRTHDDAIRQNQERTINYEVRLQAAQLGIADPNDAVKLLDWSEIEYDDNGAPTNVDDLLKTLVKAKPYLVVRKPVTSGGATNPPRSATTAPKEINAEYIRNLKPADYAALSPAQRAEIQQWMLTNSGRR